MHLHEHGGHRPHAELTGCLRHPTALMAPGQGSSGRPHLTVKATPSAQSSRILPSACCRKSPCCVRSWDQLVGRRSRSWSPGRVVLAVPRK